MHDDLKHRQQMPGIFRTWREALLALGTLVAVVGTAVLCALSLRWPALRPWAVGAMSLWAGVMWALVLARLTARRP